MLFSAGNAGSGSGTIGAPATAKKYLIETWRCGDLTSLFHLAVFSQWEPQKQHQKDGVLANQILRVLNGWRGFPVVVQQMEIESNQVRKCVVRT